MIMPKKRLDSVFMPNWWMRSMFSMPNYDGKLRNGFVNCYGCVFNYNGGNKHYIAIGFEI